MRIVAGNWRSRLLEIADVEGLRPTSERIRETLFNWLAPRIQGARCLDLCAGTGALGFEALSRGAGTAVFVERSKTAFDMLGENIALLGAANAEAINTDARRYLAGRAASPFDIVFLDPPFGADLYDELCRLLSTPGWLAEGALIYIEMPKDHPALPLPESWQQLKDKTAGNVRYMLLTNDNTRLAT